MITTLPIAEQKKKKNFFRFANNCFFSLQAIEFRSS